MLVRYLIGWLVFLSLTTSLFAQDFRYSLPTPGLYKSIAYNNAYFGGKPMDTTFRYLQIFEDSTYRLVLYHANKDVSTERLIYYEYGYCEQHRHEWILVKLYHQEAPERKGLLNSKYWFSVFASSDTALVITRDIDTEEVMDFQYSFLSNSPDNIDTTGDATNLKASSGNPVITDVSVDKVPAFDTLWEYEISVRLYELTYYPAAELRDYYPLEHYFVSSLDPTKIVKINGVGFKLELDTSGDTLETLSTVYLSGDFLGTSSGKLVFNPSFLSTRKETNPEFGNDIQFVRESSYEYSGYKYDPHIFKADMNKVISISCASKSHEKIVDACNVLTSLSAFTALFLAPLVSMNYKTGKINSTTYLTVAGIGLAGLSVSIPLSQVFKSRKYYLASNEVYSNTYDYNWFIFKRFKDKKDRSN